MSVPPFVRQQSLAVSRAIRPEDSASNISSASWTQVPGPPDVFFWNGPIDQADDDDLDLPPADLELPKMVDLDNKVKAAQESTKSVDLDPPAQAQTPADQPSRQEVDPKPAPAAKARPQMAAQSSQLHLPWRLQCLQQQPQQQLRRLRLPRTFWQAPILSTDHGS